MKKLAIICLTLLMLVSLSVSAFATNGGFVSSPSGKPGPRIIEFDPDNDACEAIIVVTPYSGREDLPDGGQELEGAYADIKGTDDVTTLNGDLADLATEKEIPGEDLGVTDLFNMHMENCDPEVHESENHGSFRIKLEGDTLEYFVGLLHKNDDGNWELIQDVVLEGDTLEFTVSTGELGPYAIVVDTNPDREPPFSGDNSYLLLWALLAAGSGMAMLFCWYRSRREEA